MMLIEHNINNKIGELENALVDIRAHQTHDIIECDRIYTARWQVAPITPPETARPCRF